MVFQPGQSGNPGGRSPAHVELVNAARAAGPEMIAVILKIARDPDMPPKVRLIAADMALDRGFGKPVQAIDARVEQHKFVVVAQAVIEDSREWQRAYGAPIIDAPGKRQRPRLLEHAVNGPDEPPKL